MLKKRLMSLLALSLQLSTSLLLASTDNEIAETIVEEHIKVGSRRLDTQKQEPIRERRTKEHEDECIQQLTKTADFRSESTHSLFRLAPAYAEPSSFTTVGYNLPVTSHSLATIADDDHSLELEDGSHWDVADVSILRAWQPGDRIVITPDYSWFSGYDYYLTNKTTNTYVKANLEIRPFTFGASSSWIVDIDHVGGGHIYLQNGLIWCVSPKDQHLIKHWAVNDPVILGLEDSIWPYYDHILINVNMDEYIRVKQY